MIVIAATKNEGKVREFQQSFDANGFKLKSLRDFKHIEEPEETGTTFIENAILKAKYYHAQTGYPCLADDSGLEVDVLNGEPGVYSARYAREAATDEENNEKLIKNIADFKVAERTARFKCALAFCDAKGEITTVTGSCEGLILTEPKGANGFGYDPLFFLPEYNKTMSELSLEEKNQISHRGFALKKMTVKLAELIK